MLRPFAHPVVCSRMLLRVDAQSLKLVKIFSQQLGTFLLFRDRRSGAQQCWIRLHSSSNIVGATHAHYAWITKRLMGCILPTMHCRSQHCWELLHPFAHHCQHTCNNSQHCWRNNVESCCARLHAALPLCKLSFAPVIAHQRLIHPLQYNEECIFCATGHSISDEPTWRITNTANTNRQWKWPSQMGERSARATQSS